MKISTKGRYALKMMLDLAEHENCGFISLKDIAKRQNISKKYLEQIIPLINKTDLLKTMSGTYGGYMLARPPEKYTVGDILRLTENGLDICTEEMHPIWRGMYSAVNKYLDSITLRDIIDNYNMRGAENYFI